jgi:hypothetical protein
MTQGLHIREQTNDLDKAPPTAQPGLFVLPMPPARSPRAHDLSTSPRFEEVASPTTAIRPSFSASQPTPAPITTRPSRAASVGEGISPFARLGLHPTPPRPTSTTESSTSPHTASQGRPPLRSTTSSSAAEGPASLPSPVVAGEESGRASPRAMFGKQQTPSERRASHRRVFSDTMSLPAFLKGRSSGGSALSSAGKK